MDFVHRIFDDQNQRIAVMVDGGSPRATSKSPAERTAEKRVRAISGAEVTNPVPLDPDALAVVHHFFPWIRDLPRVERKRAQSTALENIMRKLGQEYERVEYDADAIDFAKVARRLS